MASLRGLIGEAWSELCGGVAWVAIYKDGRSWQAEAFYPEGGDVENGLIFSAEDYREMEQIVGIDHKAIYLNGNYFGGLEDQYPEGLKGFSLDKLTDEVLYLYEARLHQLRGDFLEGMVVPLEGSQRTVDGIIADAIGKSVDLNQNQDVSSKNSIDFGFGKN